MAKSGGGGGGGGDDDDNEPKIKSAEKEENLGEKLSKGVLVGKRRAPSTPVSPWTTTTHLLFDPHSSSSAALTSPPPAHDSLRHRHRHAPLSSSARKLAAALWEFHHYFPSSSSSSAMRRGLSNGASGSTLAAGDSRERRSQPRQHRERDLELSDFLEDPCPSSSDQPASASSLRRHVVASLMQRRQPIERNNRALPPMSPASYGSSMEVTPYNPGVTPTSSLDFKERMGASHYNLKTSTELLKVLNRIWSLEEQHASNTALIKALKMELNHARVRIKELLRDQQADHHEMDDLMKQIAEDKMARKSKEQDRIHAAVQSVRDELEDERKLRKRSEGLHRKLARDLSEVKSSFLNALKELESERKSRKMLEDLCDEFAKGIKDYERELHDLKKRHDKDWADGAEGGDRLILHISESWLDERMQMKLEEAQYGLAENNSIVDKFNFEIEAFLQTKRRGTSKSSESTLPRNRRRSSLESVHLNEAISAPQDVGDEDSAASDSNCFELNKPSDRERDSKAHREEPAHAPEDDSLKTDQTEKKFAPRERFKSRDPSSIQVKFEEQMAWAVSCNGNKKPHGTDTGFRKAKEENLSEINKSHEPENCETTEEGSYNRKNKQDQIHGYSNYTVDSLIRSQLPLPEGANMHSQNDFGEGSCSTAAWRGHASPVRQWMPKITPPPGIDAVECSKLPVGLKENTLKAKLLEARLKGKGQRSRLKIFKGSS